MGIILLLLCVSSFLAIICCVNNLKMIKAVRKMRTQHDEMVAAQKRLIDALEEGIEIRDKVISKHTKIIKLYEDQYNAAPTLDRNINN